MHRTDLYIRPKDFSIGDHVELAMAAIEELSELGELVVVGHDVYQKRGDEWFKIRHSDMWQQVAYYSGALIDNGEKMSYVFLRSDDIEGVVRVMQSMMPRLQNIVELKDPEALKAAGHGLLGETYPLWRPQPAVTK